MNKKTILITGVAGLLGSRLADWIIEHKSEEYNIIGIDDLSLILDIDSITPSNVAPAFKALVEAS